MKTKHEFSGSSDKDGKFYIYNRQLFDNFVALHPNQQFEGELTLISKDDAHSDRRYYWVEVIPKLQQGLRGFGYNFTREETHDYVKQFSPVMEMPVNIGNKFTMHYKSIKKGKITEEEMKDYIEDLKRFAAEHLHTIIEDKR